MLHKRSNFLHTGGKYMPFFSRLKAIIWPSLPIFLLISSLIFLVTSRVMPVFEITSDSLDYQMTAEHILRAGSYIEISDDKLIYPPLYPVFLAFMFRLQGSIQYPWVFFLQMLCIGGTGWLTYLLVRRLTNHNPLSVITGGVMLIWPYFLLYAHMVGTEALYFFLFLASITSFVYAFPTLTWKRALFTGILFGLTILVRPVALLLPTGIFLSLGALMLLRWIPRNIPLLRFSIIVIGTSLLLLIPWIAYVGLRFHRFIPVASNLSAVSKKANSTLAYLPEYAGRNDGKAPLSQILTAKAKNVVLFWDPGADGENTNLITHRFPSAIWLIRLYRLSFLILLALATVGAYLRRKNLQTLVILSAILYVWAVHTVLFPFPRYTAPVHPLVLILVTIALIHSHSVCLPLSWSSFQQRMKQLLSKP